ncbi:carbamoyl-phosphate synthase large subunit [Flavobacterium sp. 103]|uniref:ATP-grasp domain-containing protein n=1 Tax=unclassified Flavobacterium TaxID=196869 RepID=UPI000D5CBE7A|nr:MULTISPECIES: ATP-grasp domain-containing protein [unclassified Flavobacterium]PVX47006.1 carbamoyl-phosphate synthase large subunit [Flavobacterium sp. 103]QKJ64459.1 ATP-grasp domain-containing protein [Flavobacterium sp. M31R6]
MSNILITCAGKRVSLVRSFKTELKLIFSDSKVYTTDSSPEKSAACRVSDGYFKVSPVTHYNYIDDLLQIAIDNNIKLIIPTIDPELLVLSQNIDLFKKHHIEILISDYENIETLINKRLTNVFFKKLGINYAKEFDKDNFTLPLYIKPIDGSRSIDNYIVKKESELTAYHFSNEKLLFFEYLEHTDFTEYTIDMYFDKTNNLKCLIPRERLEIRAGEVNKAITRRTWFIDEIASKFKHISGLRGCISLQLFVNNETEILYGIEINPRFSGGFPLSYLAGGNYPKWIIQEYILGESQLAYHEDWEENLMMLRYDDEILIRDYDSVREIKFNTNKSEKITIDKKTL